MPAPSSVFSPVLRSGAFAVALLCASSWAAPTAKPTPTPAAASAPAASTAKPNTVVNSEMDAQLFYQLLIAEIQANANDPGSAYQLYLDAARRTKNAQLYQRAVEVALRARAGEQALIAARAWRSEHPQSLAAAEFTTQILIALGRTSEIAAPLGSVLKLTPKASLGLALTTTPRNLSRLPDKSAAAQIVDEVTAPWRSGHQEMAEAWAASAEAWYRAGKLDQARTSLTRAGTLNANLPTVALLATEMMKTSPEIEASIVKYLQRPDAAHNVRLAYARQLTLLQRYQEAEPQLETLVKDQPEQNSHWLLLAAIRLELKKVAEAEAALKPVLDRANSSTSTEATAPTKPTGLNPDLEQAYLLMAQAAELKKNTPDALRWMEAADPRQEKLLTQSQRARILARLGRIKEARAAIQKVPENSPSDGLQKIQAEAEVLREAKLWDDAYKVLKAGQARFPDDTSLMYDLAMMADRVKQPEEMERLLRQVLKVAPDNANALNALGYSFADRGIHLAEARTLINKALQQRPGDPFITDSLGWLEFRAGNITEALKLLQQAWQAHPDAEIAAHLGEVLWSQGQTDQAREIWRQGLKLDRHNEIIESTLQRLKVKL